MKGRPLEVLLRWIAAFGALAIVVWFYSRWHVNPTTVAMTFLLLVLLLAASWGVVYAVVIAIAATVAYNYFFLPPLYSFTIADPQNWLALFAFLSTAGIASRLSERARQQAAAAKAREQELELLFRLSMLFLQAEDVLQVRQSIPSVVMQATGCEGAALLLLDQDKAEYAGSILETAWPPPRLRQLTLESPDDMAPAGYLAVPVQTGVRARGVLLLGGGVTLEESSARTLGGLVSLAIDHAQALELVSRERASVESERLRATLTDSITHELRTPLTAIKGAVTALRSGVARAEDSRELLAVIEEESDRLNALVTEAVEVAQIHAGRLELALANVPLAEVVAAAREATAWVEEQHPVNVDILPEIAVRADAALLSRVFSNLLENAAKYSDAGAAIEIDAHAVPDAIVVSVRDHGMGVPEEEYELIFERFYRGASVGRRIPGTGMGLAISRAIVEAHGGTIVCESAPDAGSTFILRLPGLARA